MPQLVDNRCRSTWPKRQHDGRAPRRPRSVALAALRHVLGNGPVGTPVIGYLEFVKTGEHRVAHEEMHKPQSSSDRCREPVERHRKQLAGVMASNALHREPAHYRPETCGLHV
jgi:hypothetical protein